MTRTGQAIPLPLLVVEPALGRSTAAYRWRLVARNGRPLGESASEFPDSDSAERAFRALVRRAGEVTATVGHAPTRGWIWRIDNDRTETIVRSPRSYDRHGSCLRAGVRMIENLRRMPAE